MRVFLDTNVLISALSAHGLCAELFRVIVAEHELLTGEVNLAEMRRVLLDRFKFSERQVTENLAVVREHTIVPRPQAPAQLTIRDADDLWVIESALQGGADFLVSGDKDLHEIAAESPIPILTPRAAWEKLRS